MNSLMSGDRLRQRSWIHELASNLPVRGGSRTTEVSTGE